ncbi:MAG: ATP-binding cassette domain-containing protein [Anaerolineales bacterium]|nr:ATP-binding cassette domain-containing protein [Anaerolineales bacterium]
MTFPNGNGGLRALDNVSFEVRRQEFVCVVGPSGCGKTTLLRLLAGLLQATEGEIVFEGKPLRQPRRRIGFVFQQANLMPWRSVLDNIALPLELQGEPTVMREARARDLIELVGLSGFESSYPRDLSGGMAQRVAIARAMIHEPDLLLLDEPFGSLDALTRERMETELMRIWAARTVTVVMVTHSISEAVLLADRVVVLSDRPARVCLDLPIHLARPRQLEMAHTRPFGDLVAQVRRAIEGGC